MTDTTDPTHAADTRGPRPMQGHRPSGGGRPLPCPHCSHPLEVHDCATDPGAPPDDGDVAICWRCRSPALFTLSPLGVLGLRACSADEERELMADPRITATLDAAADMTDPTRAAALAHAYMQERR